MQPLHGCSLHPDLPDQRVVQARRRHRGLRLRRLHRVQGVHAGVPVRRHLHRQGRQHRGEVQLLRPPRRQRSRAGLRDRVPDPLDLGRRPRRPRVRHQPADRRERHGRPCPRAADRSERALRRSVTGRARPARRTGQGRLPVVAAGRPAAADVGGQPGRRPAHHDDAQHRAPASVGLASGHLSVDQGRRGGCAARRRDQRAPRSGPGRAAGRGAHRRGDRHGDDRRPARVGPQAAGTVPLPAHPAEHHVLAGQGRLVPDGDRGRVRRLDARSARRDGRRRARRRRAGGAGRTRSGDGSRVHRLPVRAGGGSGPLAVALAVARPARPGRLRRCRPGRHRAGVRE